MTTEDAQPVAGDPRMTASKFALLFVTLTLAGCGEQVGIPGPDESTSAKSTRAAFFDPAFGVVCYAHNYGLSCLKVAEGTALARQADRGGP